MIDSVATQTEDTPWRIDADCVLAFGDVHQRVNWAQAVMAHETGHFDHLVFLGDAVHSWDDPPAVAGIRETARFYASLISRPDATVLLGNHDAPLMECDTHARHFRKKHNLLHGCAGFRHNHAIEFAKEMTMDLWKRVKLFCVANGWLLSHAGIHESFWRPLLNEEMNLAALHRDAEEALQLIQFRRHPLLAMGPGRLRTGEIPDALISGCTWQDWDKEFADTAVLPQLVGHSHEMNLVRRIGRSFCIDTGIGYALIRRDGSIEHKALKCVRVDGECTWVPETPQFRDDSEKPVLRQRAAMTSLSTTP